MKIKMRSQTGEEYYSIFMSEDFDGAVKTVLKNGMSHVKVFDKHNRKGLLKVTEIESFILEEQND